MAYVSFRFARREVLGMTWLRLIPNSSLILNDGKCEAANSKIYRQEQENQICFYVVTIEPLLSR
jgi:hypothetical protein